MRRKHQLAWIPKKYALLLIIILLALYFRMIRPQEQANDVDIAGDYAYLAVGEAGLRVVDIKNPGNPHEVGAYDSLGYANRVTIAGKYAYLADGRRGVVLLDISDPLKPKEIAKFQTDRPAEDVAVAGNLAYVAAGSAGLQIVRFSDMYQPAQVSKVGFDTPIVRVVVQGNFVYVADRRGKLWITEKTALETPQKDQQKEHSFQAPGAIRDMKIVGRFAYLAVGPAGLLVLDLASPLKPEQVAQIDTPGFANGVEIAGIYAYVADSDRGIRIVDISNPAALVDVGGYTEVKNALDVASAGEYAFIADETVGLRSIQVIVQVNPIRTVAGGTHGNVRDVAVLGKFAFLACEEEGVRILNIENPEAIRELSVFHTSDRVVAVKAAGDYVYAANQGEGLRVLQIDAQSEQGELKEFSHLDTPGLTNDLVLAGDLVYLADGPAGLRVVDLKDPAAPVEIGALDIPGGAVSLAVLKNRAYVASGKSGLQIVDIADPGKMAVIGALNTPGDAQAVTVGTGKDNQLLAVIADGDSGARVVDVTDPIEPRELGFYEGVGFVQDAVLSDGIAYLAARQEGLIALSLADPITPLVIGLLNTPGEAQSIVPAKPYLFLADYDRGLRAINISDLKKMAEVGFWDVARVVTNLVASGQYIYLLDGTRGVRVEDMRNPLRPIEVGLYQAPGRIYSLEVFRTNLLTAGNFGFQLLDISEPKKPRLIGSAPTAGIARAIAVQDRYVYLAEGDIGMQILDIADPAKVQVLSTYDTVGQAMDIAVSGNYVLLADGAAGLQIVNVADPRNPKTTRIMSEFNDARGVLIAGGYAYVANGIHGIGIVNVTKPTEPEIISQVDTEGTALDLAYSDAYLFIADGQQGIQVLYVINPRAPQWVGTGLPPGGGLPIAALVDPSQGERIRQFLIYAADGDQGLEIFIARKAVRVTRLHVYETPGLAPIGETVGSFLLAIPNVMVRQPSQISLKAWRTLGWLSTDFFFFIIVFLMWLGLTSQFILPIHRASDRGLAIARLFEFFFGRHGPAIFVKEGKKVAKPGELERQGVGVIMVDPNSAVVLENRRLGYSSRQDDRMVTLERLFRQRSQDPVRVVGPGVAFMAPDETIRGVVDLRPQFRICPEVPAYTSDGIEVNAHVLLLFTLGQPPDELFIEPVVGIEPEDWRLVSLEEQKGTGPAHSRPRKYKVTRSAPLRDELEPDDIKQVWDYYYKRAIQRDHLPCPKDPLWEELRTKFDEKRVRSAIYTLSRRAKTGELDEWTDLPGKIGTEAYRNILAEYTFDDLFKPNDPLAQPALFVAKSRLRRQVRSGGILAFRILRLLSKKNQKRMKVGQTFSESELAFSPVQEFRLPVDAPARVDKTLRECGIKIIYAGFTLPRPANEEVYKQRLASWQTQWKSQEELIRGQTESGVLMKSTQIIANAQKRIVKLISEALESTTYSDEALAFGVLQILEDAAEDPETRHLLPGEVTEYFRHLRSWLQ